MTRGTFRAMGTTVEVWATEAAGLPRVRDWFAEVEAIATRFEPSSELSALNGETGSDEVAVSPLLARILGAAWMARDLTDGLVDPAVGSDVLRWGYDRTFADVTDVGAPLPGPAIPDWSIDGTTVRRPPGTLLDLGGVAKGWAADSAVESGAAIVVGAGGDIRSEHPECEVRVLGPDDSVAAVVRLGRGGLATSSTSRRRWRAGGRDAHHLIDPRTGKPAEGPVVSATAVARTAVLAEAAAKAILIHGSDGLAWAAGQPWVGGALVVWEDGAVFATTGLEVAA